jgi:Uma2 family endonuclease
MWVMTRLESLAYFRKVPPGLPKTEMLTSVSSGSGNYPFLALRLRTVTFLPAMSLTKPAPRLSEAQYLETERAADFKSEFFDGETFAMAGGTPQHSLIATNLAREFGNKLTGGPCAAYNSDLRLKIEPTGLCTYPDLSVICGPLQFAKGTDDTVINPSVIVEVLSNSTEAYDRGRKFEHYRQIVTLREYVLVSQTEPRVEQFIRQADDRWLLVEATGINTMLEIPSLRATISLAEVFAKVKFVPAPIRPRPFPTEPRS